MQQEQVPIRNGYDIGIGVAAATGSPMALGATGAVTAPQVGTGGSGSFNFRRLESNEDLATELGIGADISAGVGLFSASASFDFTKKCKLQSSSLAVVVSAEERFAFQQMDSPTLSPAAAQLVEDGNVAQFADQFGEYFVRGIVTGGRFVGVMRIDTRSAQSRTDVDTALSASYGLTVDVDVKVKISNALTSANARVEAFVLHDGGRITTRPTSADPLELLTQLYEAMEEWTSTVRGEPKAYNVTLAPYIIALGPEPPNSADLEHQRDVLIRCAKLRTQTMDKLNLIEYILDPNHKNEFSIIDPPSGPDLPAVQAGLAGDLDVIAEAASFAINHAKDARTPETFMREVKGVADFTLTALPSKLPEHAGLSLVAVPNFVGMKFDEAHLLAENAHIALSHEFPPLLFDLRVKSQNFPPGALIPDPRAGGLVVAVTLTFENASLPPPE